MNIVIFVNVTIHIRISWIGLNADVNNTTRHQILVELLMGHP